MNFLNIDDFSKTTRQIKIGGTAHIVQEQTVQQFIDGIKVAEELEKEAASGAFKPLASLEQAIKSVCQSVPTLPESQVRALTLPALTAVLDFIRGDAAGAAQSTPAGDTGEKKPE